MSAEAVIILAFGLILGVPLSLIFWAHIYVAVRDIVGRK